MGCIDIATATFTTLLLFLPHYISATIESTFQITSGHYPSTYCHVTDVMLRPDEHRFLYRKTTDVVSDAERGCASPIWSLEHASLSFEKCDRTFDVGHAFTIFYYYGSNYFHLHYDTLFPLYLAVYHDKESTDEKTHAFMPTVETSRLQPMDWNTTAFSDESKYWIQMVKAITGNHTYLPLDARTRDFGETICFKEIYFGAPSTVLNRQNIVHGFVDHIQRTLGVTVRDDTPHRVAIISRRTRGRRQILNENELVQAISAHAPVDLVDFVGMTYREQVSLMQNYTILVGMNGAGLTNGLFLPPGGVAVQLVPAAIELNVREFGELLRGGAGGGYLEWHDRTPPDRVERVNGFVTGNTVVDAGELVEVVREAMRLVEEFRQRRRNTEL